MALAELEAKLGHVNAARELYTRALLLAQPEPGPVSPEPAASKGADSAAKEGPAGGAPWQNLKPKQNPKPKKKKFVEVVDTAPVLLAWSELEERSFTNGSKALQLLRRASKEHPANIKVARDSAALFLGGQHVDQSSVWGRGG